MDDIDSILSEASQNVFFDTLANIDLTQGDVSAALDRVLHAVIHGKDMGIFTEEEHEANILAVSIIGMHLLKAYPELMRLMKHYLKDGNKDDSQFD